MSTPPPRNDWPRHVRRAEEAFEEGAVIRVDRTTYQARLVRDGDIVGSLPFREYVDVERALRKRWAGAFEVVRGACFLQPASPEEEQLQMDL